MLIEKVADKSEFLVIHPIDDIQEQKVETQNVGPMRLTPAVKLSLFALRGYLVLMMLLVVYRILDMTALSGKP